MHTFLTRLTIKCNYQSLRMTSKWLHRHHCTIASVMAQKSLQTETLECEKKVSFFHRAFYMEVN